MFWQRLLLLLPWRRRAAERDMQEELRSIAAMAAPHELGSLSRAAEDARVEWSWRWLGEFGQDARHAARTLRRSPAFTLVAVASLALGLGANVVIFSVVDAALFRPLPYAHADRVVDLFVTGRTPDGDTVRVQAAGRRLDDLRAMPGLFDAVEGVDRPSSRALAAGADADPMVGAFSPGFLDMLGVAPQLGRGFRHDDVPAGDRIVISDAYWQRAFDRDPAAIGRTIPFSNLTAVIVGVMPPTLRHFVGVETDAWVPIDAHDATRLVARLRPGLALDRAQREASASPDARSLDIVSGDWWRAHGPLSIPGRSARAMLFSLLGSAAFLLAIACANVASLLIVRTNTRQREIAVRAALGATRGRVARQFLTEGVCLAALGGAAALAVAAWGIGLLPAIVPADMRLVVFGVASPALDWRAVAFGSVAALLTAALSGVVPAWRASRSVAGEAAVGQRIAGGRRSERVARDAFQGIQVALTIVLLVGAGLLITSLSRLIDVPVGYDVRNLGFAEMTLPRRAPLDDGQRATFDGLLARVRLLPGVEGVTVGLPPIIGGATGGNFLAEDSSAVPVPSVPVEVFTVRPDYFQVVGIPLSEGRLLGADDRRNTPLVAVISDNVAGRLWPGQSPIGRRFRLHHSDAPLVTVVGVVPRVRTTLLARETAVVYTASAQGSERPNVLFRIAGDTTATLNAIRQEFRAADPLWTLTRMGMVETLSAERDPTAPARFYALLFGVFAGLAVLTAAVGLYGLLSYSVSRRTREIGVRIALGASVSSVRRLVLRELSVPVAGGIVVGLFVSSQLWVYLGSRLFQVEPGEPTVLAAVVAFFLVVCAIAALVPVRRATRIDPAEALRTE